MTEEIIRTPDTVEDWMRATLAALQEGDTTYADALKAGANLDALFTAGGNPLGGGGGGK